MTERQSLLSAPGDEASESWPPDIPTRPDLPRSANAAFGRNRRVGATHQSAYVSRFKALRISDARGGVQVNPMQRTPDDLRLIGSTPERASGQVNSMQRTTDNGQLTPEG